MDVKQVPLYTVADLKKRQGRLVVVVDGREGVIELSDLREYLLTCSMSNPLSQQTKAEEVSQAAPVVRTALGNPIPAGYTLRQLDSAPENNGSKEPLLQTPEKEKK